MPIVYCPNCSKKIQAPAEGIGKRGQCPACKSWVTITAEDQQPPGQKHNDAPAAMPPPRQQPVSGTRNNRVPVVVVVVAVAGIALIVGGTLYLKRSVPLAPNATVIKEPTPETKVHESIENTLQTDPPKAADTSVSDSSTPAHMTEAEYKGVRRDELDKLRVSDPARWQTEMDWLKIHDQPEWLAIQARDRQADNASKQAELTNQYRKRDEQRQMRRDARAESNKFRSATDKASQAPADATSMGIGGSPPDANHPADRNSDSPPDAAAKSNPDGSGTRGYFTGKPGGSEADKH